VYLAITENFPARPIPIRIAVAMPPMRKTPVLTLTISTTSFPVTRFAPMEEIRMRAAGPMGIVEEIAIIITRTGATGKRK